MRDRLKEILKRVLELGEVADDISRQNCESWDSLKHLVLIVELEAEFNISIEPEDIVAMNSLGEIEKRIDALTKA